MFPRHYCPGRPWTTGAALNGAKASRMRSPGSRRETPFFALSLVAIVILAAFVASACSSGPNLYTDEDFGFSFEYPAGWQIQHVAPADLLPGVSKEIGAFDLRGSDAGDDETWDMVSVEVYQGGIDLGYTLEDIDLSLTDYLAEMQGSLPTLVALESPTPVTVGGLSGYKITYRGYVGTDQVHASEYMLLSPTVTYNLRTQSAEQNWNSNQSVFGDFLATFDPGS